MNSIDRVPEFKLPDQSGQTLDFETLKGPKGLVLYVYPKDNTSGCTVEAEEFRDRADDLRKLGFGVVGLSRDSVASHEKFATKLGLNFSLLSDPKTDLIQSLGAWGEKKMAGKVSTGTIRSTFIFDPDGKLIKRYPKVKAKGHADSVISDIKASSE